ncbi:uncharacterized protein LOC113076626 [Carassius auratus]|uniref:Uncharacterized protein LOC113076626 n=1 Tax=Carassius auratus TaxID=7957 RepID=A0A6P6N9C6_CARAU|nr:uncharacterized protein LOC113076626 [Carassius auratus]
MDIDENPGPFGENQPTTQSQLVPKKGSHSVVWKYFGFKQEDQGQSGVICKVICKVILMRWCSLRTHDEVHGDPLETPISPERSSSPGQRRLDRSPQHHEYTQLRQGVSSMETTVRNTDHAMAFMNETVEKLLKDTANHNGRIVALEKKTIDLREENTQLKLQLLEANSYRRRWGLRLQGMKEEDQQENTRDMVINILGKISPKIAGKLPEVVDSVHRIGKRKDGNTARSIIIQFSMRHCRDIVWRDAKGSKFLEDAHLRLKEDLSPDERAVRAKESQRRR